MLERNIWRVPSWRGTRQTRFMEISLWCRYSEELDMTNAEAMDISLVKYARIYLTAAAMGVSKSVSIACMVLIVGFGIYAFLM